MKTIACFVVAAAALAPAAQAADARPAATLVGAWSVDTSRLPMPAAQRPKSVTLTFAAEGAQALATRVEVVDPAGATLVAEGVTPLDGTPTAVKANFEADMSATTMPRPDLLIMQLARNGSPASTRIYAVGADGRSMIETVAHFDAAGRPVLRQNHFTRLR